MIRMSCQAVLSQGLLIRLSRCQDQVARDMHAICTRSRSFAGKNSGVRTDTGTAILRASPKLARRG
jgi:hypothetical protein